MLLKKSSWAPCTLADAAVWPGWRHTSPWVIRETKSEQFITFRGWVMQSTKHWGVCLSYWVDLSPLSHAAKDKMVSLPFSSLLSQLDSRAQNELKDGMKTIHSKPGLKKSWDNVQKMVSAGTKQPVLPQVVDGAVLQAGLRQSWQQSAAVSLATRCPRTGSHFPVIISSRWRGA